MILELNSPLDMHLHLRDGDMLNTTVPASSRSFSGALIMPNLTPPVTSLKAAGEYEQRITHLVADVPFEPYMTLFFDESRTKRELEDARKAQESILAVKLYPSGITSNSESGVSIPLSEKTLETISILEELDIVLCVHGEDRGFVMDREAGFAEVYEQLASAFPKLRIVMEHITTKTLADLLDKHRNLFATITLHHLMITLDDVIGGELRPHNFCKPVAKRPQDREALLRLATSAHPKVMFGSDSAPHPKNKKESCCGAAGVFHAPFAVQALAELFEKEGKLENLQKFVSDNARNIYRISPPKKLVILEKKPFSVPSSYNEVVPFLFSEKLVWDIKKIV